MAGSKSLQRAMEKPLVNVKLSSNGEKPHGVGDARTDGSHRCGMTCLGKKLRVLWVGLKSCGCLGPPEPEDTVRTERHGCTSNYRIWVLL